MKYITAPSTRIALISLVGILALGACGDTALSESTEPGWSSSASATDATNSTTAAAEEGVFDSSYVHEISVEFDAADYDAMIETYSSTGDKAWIEATVTIDGTTYEQVGIRLKGNSSLRGLAGGGGGTAGELSADAPEGLPWLIRLDKYVDGQSHDGVADFVVRSNATSTSLNEAVALDLLEEAGVASQDAMATRFSINGGDEALRLVIEHPDDIWMAGNFESEGALYKAESTGDYSYRGDNPDSYDEVFDQEAGMDTADLSPLIEVLDFINNSDDETFAAEVDGWLDIGSFATYLAMQDIIQNFDDIDGPGNNSYLYYNAESGEFTVVAWDHNLAFGVTAAGPGGSGGLEGGEMMEPAGDGGGLGGGEVLEPPEGSEPGARPMPGQGLEPSAEGAPGGPGGALGGSNVLVERFLAVGDFAALYEQQLVELEASLVDSGLADEILATWVEVLERDASDLISAETITSEAAQLSRQI